MEIPVPAVKFVLVNPVPLPISKAPLTGVELNPVPPLAIGRTPLTWVVRLIVPLNALVGMVVDTVIALEPLA